MHTILCEPCAGLGKVEYTTEPFLRDCLICLGLGTIEITADEYERLQALEEE